MLKKTLLTFYIILFIPLLLFGLVQKAFSIDYESDSNTITTRVGSPTPIPTNTGGSCWPTTGQLTQGPQGGYDHIGLYRQGLQAVDIGNVIGTPIYASFNGTVQQACNDAQTSCGVFTGCNENGCGYGRHVVITGSVEGKSFTAFYGHFTSLSVAQGSTVKVGDQIGIMGKTGYSTGPHTHYELRGISLAQPYLPENITPPDCNAAGACRPDFVPTSEVCNVAAKTAALSKAPAQGEYWFMLHRKSKKEYLYQGVPGDTTKSTVAHMYQVNPGLANQTPTPLPSKVGKEYWTIEALTQSTDLNTYGPYFLRLDIPWQDPQSATVGGPNPYLECGQNGSQQCNWKTPLVPQTAPFGLHGDGDAKNSANVSRVTTDQGSTGCIRHFDDDISQIYKILTTANQPATRYYINDD